jgi:hypothetical protein
MGVDVSMDKSAHMLDIMESTSESRDASSYVTEPGRPPANGKYYTWEDDVLNRRMREEERYVAISGQPAQHSPHRCKGFSINLGRPCRQWAMKNVDEMYLTFCKSHSMRVWGFTGANRDVTEVTQAWTASANMAKASAATKHGAYSTLMKIRLTAIMEMKHGKEERDKVVALMDAMESVDTDNPSDSLDFMIRTNMGMMAELLEGYAAGNIKFGDFMLGVTMVSDTLRKLTSTKHEVVGTADDENERAIKGVLDEMGLGTESGMLGVPALSVAVASSYGEEEDEDDADEEIAE